MILFRAMFIRSDQSVVVDRTSERINMARNSIIANEDVSSLWTAAAAAATDVSLLLPVPSDDTWVFRSNTATEAAAAAVASLSNTTSFGVSVL